MADDPGGYRGERRKFTHSQWQTTQPSQSSHPSGSSYYSQQSTWSNAPALDLVDPLLSSRDWNAPPRAQHSSSPSVPHRPQPNRASTSVINASPYQPLEHKSSDWRPSGILPPPSRPPGWRIEPRSHGSSSPAPLGGTHTPPSLPPFDLSTLGRNLPHDVFQQQGQAERFGEDEPLPSRFSFDPWAPLPGTSVHPRPPTTTAQPPSGGGAHLAYHDARAAANTSGYSLAPLDQGQHPWASAPSIEHRETPPPPPSLPQNRIGSAPPQAIGDSLPFPPKPQNELRQAQAYQAQQQFQQHQQPVQSPGSSSLYSNQGPSSVYSSSSGLWSNSQPGYRGTSSSSGWTSHRPSSQAGSSQWGSNLHEQGHYSPFPSPTAGLKNLQYRSYAAYTHSAAPIGTPPPIDQYAHQPPPFSSATIATYAPTADPVHAAAQPHSSSPLWPTALAPQLAPAPVQPPPLTPQPRSNPLSVTPQARVKSSSKSKARSSRPNSAAAVTLPSGLPLNPARSPWAMWAGNVPADTTQDEIWAFFRAQSGPPGSTDGAGIESIHMIARSNCAFVNYLTEPHLLHAIATISGQPLRPRDKKCKPLLCRIRQREDDAKSGVGAQRMTGIHRAFVKDKETKLARPPLRAGFMDRSELSSEAVASESGADEAGSQGSSSGQSSDSSLFLAHFPKRYFILKSHNVDDLDESVRRGWWSTQAHNEYVLDQAYRTAKEGVFIFFSANKSGQWYGYARMAGPIIPPGKDKSSSSSSDDPSSLLPSDLLADSPPRMATLDSSEPDQQQPQSGEGGTSAPGRPFRVEWIKTQRLPFARTKHVANGFNSGREVKISRDGTEVEPGSGEQMVALFESLKPPKPVVQRPAGVRKTSSNSTVHTVASSAGSSIPGTPAVA